MIPNLTIVIAAYVILRCLEISLTPVVVAEGYAGRQSFVRAVAVVVILVTVVVTISTLGAGSSLR